jgi:hypothetical protein
MSKKNKVDPVPHIKVVSADDWTGLYIDGKLKLENHNLHWDEILDAIGVDYESDVIDEDWMEANGRLPENLSDVKLT